MVHGCETDCEPQGMGGKRLLPKQFWPEYGADLWYECLTDMRRNRSSYHWLYIKATFPLGKLYFFQWPPKRADNFRTNPSYTLGLPLVMRKCARGAATTLGPSYNDSISLSTVETTSQLAPAENFYGVNYWRTTS